MTYNVSGRTLNLTLPLRRGVLGKSSMYAANVLRAKTDGSAYVCAPVGHSLIISVICLPSCD